MRPQRERNQTQRAKGEFSPLPSSVGSLSFRGDENHVNSPSSAFASCKSFVPNLSVNPW